MFYLFLDLIIYNYTPYLSYFFLINLNDKSYIYNISIALLIDFLILHIPLLTTLWVTILYFLKKYLFKFNYHIFYIYVCFNLGIIFLYYLVNSLLFSSVTIIGILNVLIINGVFVAISYKRLALDIK